MYGLTFDLDVRMIEEEYGKTRTEIYEAIEKKLLELKFKRAQYGFYYYPEPIGIINYALLVYKTFLQFRYAPAMRDLQGFEIRECTTFDEVIVDGHSLYQRAKKPMWPEV